VKATAERANAIAATCQVLAAPKTSALSAEMESVRRKTFLMPTLSAITPVGMDRRVFATPLMLLMYREVRSEPLGEVLEDVDLEGVLLSLQEPAPLGYHLDDASAFVVQFSQPVLRLKPIQFFIGLHYNFR
jgi:hypothetical protein